MYQRVLIPGGFALHQSMHLSPYGPSGYSTAFNANSNSICVRCSDSCNERRKERRPRKICRVCGDIASCNNFNVLSCPSCKEFFRRNVHKEDEMHCPFNGTCEVTLDSRRSCRSCRYMKCLNFLNCLTARPVERVREMKRVTSQLFATSGMNKERHGEPWRTKDDPRGKCEGRIVHHQGQVPNVLYALDIPTPQVAAPPVTGQLMSSELIAHVIAIEQRHQQALEVPVQYHLQHLQPLQPPFTVQNGVITDPYDQITQAQQQPILLLTETIASEFPPDIDPCLIDPCSDFFSQSRQITSQYPVSSNTFEIAPKNHPTSLIYLDSPYSFQ